jgi:hypothetical protein
MAGAAALSFTLPITGLIVRFTVADVFLPQEIRDRQFFTPDRGASALPSSIETRAATGGGSFCTSRR